MMNAADLDPLDRRIVNALQEGFPVCERPYAEAARALGIGEAELIERLRGLLERGVLSRFGPLYNAEAMGGGLSLCAMQVPRERFDAVAEQVNRHPEVAHNYARDHALNLWFVVATERPGQVEAVLRRIEAETGLAVLNLPKLREFHLALRFEA
jgi:DNA-binding Lrp family transcriptional regulator